MIFSKKIVVLSFSLFLLLLATSLCADTQTPSSQTVEMEKPRLEGLKEFHETLHSVWHEAYPNRDYEAIKDAVPEFKQRMEVLRKAELPGFFPREKRGI